MHTMHIKSTVVMLLKATKGKSQNRISLKRQRFFKSDKSKIFHDFYLVYKYACLKIMPFLAKFRSKLRFFSLLIYLICFD